MISPVRHQSRTWSGRNESRANRCREFPRSMIASSPSDESRSHNHRPPVFSDDQRPSHRCQRPVGIPLPPTRRRGLLRPAEAMGSAGTIGSGTGYGSGSTVSASNGPEDTGRVRRRVDPYVKSYRAAIPCDRYNNSMRQYLRLSCKRPMLIASICAIRYMRSQVNMGWVEHATNPMPNPSVGGGDKPFSGYQAPSGYSPWQQLNAPTDNGTINPYSAYIRPAIRSTELQLPHQRTDQRRADHATLWAAWDARHGGPHGRERIG